VTINRPDGGIRPDAYPAKPTGIIPAAQGDKAGWHSPVSRLTINLRAQCHYAQVDRLLLSQIPQFNSATDYTDITEADDYWKTSRRELFTREVNGREFVTD
jgi:hypothetical protein